MNAPQGRALALDAIFQVLDNQVFRILLVLALVPILMTFLIGFREEEIVLLFGVKSWEYGTLLQLFGGMGGSIPDPRGAVIEGVLEIVFGFLAGAVGILFCIAATAFFVPRMIEKGAADVLFHKPLGRLTFYLSRYFAGLFFICALVSFTAVGMYTGLLLVSGHNDLGILCVIPGLTYLFGLVHAVSMLIGVVTRSTVASILLTILFFFGNGCVHNIWLFKEQVRSSEQMEAVMAEVAEEEIEEDDPGAFLTAMVRLLDGLHYALPKTTDVDVITKKLRKAVGGPLYRDDESLFTVYGVPDGFEQAPAADGAGGVPAALREFMGEPGFAAVRSEAPEVSYRLWRREARDEETASERTGRTRTRRETVSRAVDELDELLAAAGIEAAGRDSVSFGANARVLPTSGSVAWWTEGEGEGATSTAVLTLRGGDLLYHLWIETEGELTEERRQSLIDSFGRVAGLENLMSQPGWYEQQFGLDAPWKYNVLFSIASSLAFTALMLGIGWWRLRRIEF